MKRVLVILVLLLFGLILPSSFAAELYQYDSLDLELSIDGAFKLIPQTSTSKVKEVTTELLLYPNNDYRQTQKNFKSAGTLQNDVVNFAWYDEQLGQKRFGYTTTVNTQNKRLEVKTKIPFPLTNIQGYEQYLEPTKTIDSNNPAIIAKATELADGEDDLFKVAFKLASWVEENVEYDLNTLTEKASQKASWVLQNRQGVCDEMTSLFVAMARSLGIPARFASGISYTTSELFDYNWQPHGWAEAYFPGVGWVSFDITFGEYGYIDVTHIKLRDGFDPQEPATKYEWLADRVDLEAEELDLVVNIKNRGQIIPEELTLDLEMLSPEVGFGSYNLVKGVLKNTVDHYAATTLSLALPEELDIQGDNKRTILLAPLEEKETFWTVYVTNKLDSNYEYTFPILIYSEENVTFTSSFLARSDQTIFTRTEIDALIVKDEDKSYSRKVGFNCNYPEELDLNMKEEVTCTIKNQGNANLEEVIFCIDDDCETINLPINQEKSISKTIGGDTAGWKKFSVSAVGQLIEKRDSFTYAVQDQPKLSLVANYPQSVKYGHDFSLILELNKESFSNPENIEVLIKGAGFRNEWQVDVLRDKEQLALELPGSKLSSTNKFQIITTWTDSNNKDYSTQESIVIEGKYENFSERIKMIINGIVNIFS
jgi:hypothetical protein